MVVQAQTNSRVTLAIKEYYILTLCLFEALNTVILVADCSFLLLLFSTPERHRWLGVLGDSCHFLPGWIARKRRLLFK